MPRACYCAHQTVSGVCTNSWAWRRLGCTPNDDGLAIHDGCYSRVRCAQIDADRAPSRRDGRVSFSRESGAPRETSQKRHRARQAQ